MKLRMQGHPSEPRGKGASGVERKLRRVLNVSPEAFMTHEVLPKIACGLIRPSKEEEAGIGGFIFSDSCNFCNTFQSVHFACRRMASQITYRTPLFL